MIDWYASSTRMVKFKWDSARVWLVYSEKGISYPWVSSWLAQSIYTAVDRTVFPCRVKYATMLTADRCTQNITNPCSYCSSLKMKAVETFIKIISIVFDKWRAFLKHCIISFAFPKPAILLNLYIKSCTILCNWVRYLSHNAASRGN